MKKLLLALVLVAGIAQADDIVLIDGTVYKNAKIISHTAAYAVILDDDGGATVPIAKLSPALKRAFAYDPVAAQQEIKADKIKQQQQDLEDLKQEAVTLIEQRLDQTKIDVRCNVMEVLPDGILAENAVSVDAATQGYAQRVGNSDLIFIQCNPKGLVDDQLWTGAIWKVGTYSYSNTLGSTETVDRFTSDRDDAGAQFLREAASGP